MASILVSADSVATAFKAWTVSDAGARWKIARDILGLVDGAAEGKSREQATKDVAEKCAAAIGRAKPFSTAWVRLICAGARKYPTKPTTPADCADFLATINGAQSKGKGKAGASTKEDALKMLKSAAKMALKRGADEDELSAALAEVFDTAAATV